MERAAATLLRELQNALASVRRRREISDGNPCKFFKRAATGGVSTKSFKSTFRLKVKKMSCLIITNL
jgi:hypothetical protein